MLFKILVVWFITSGLAIAYYARRELLISWREPVLQRPVLIIESDDWGAGPSDQSEALGSIAQLLAGFKDCDGRHPLMTLGIVLASADGERIRATGNYQRQLISTSTHGSLLETINNGVDAGVFDIQLHGLEHYWPSALMEASQCDESVMAWLQRAPFSLTEDLPSPLQSRWVNAVSLPAEPINDREVLQAVREETSDFEAVFGSVPGVAVPPTFIWNECVEKGWAAGGVNVVVTPGRRYESRGDDGQPSAAGDPVYNGQPTGNGMVYMVRNSYFEPSMGHMAEQAMAALDLKTGLGQPALLETHRFNFLGSIDKKNRSVQELKRFLEQALAAYPNVAFISTGKLAMILKDRDPGWVEQRPGPRLHFWLRRLGKFPRVRKLAWLSGWILPAVLVWKLTGYT
jgi:hypothetical protein